MFRMSASENAERPLWVENVSSPLGCVFSKNQSFHRNKGEKMLQLRPNCECCDKDLPPESTDARICSFECTFCADCVTVLLKGKCPNCGGELVRRPSPNVSQTDAEAVAYRCCPPPTVIVTLRSISPLPNETGRQMKRHEGRWLMAGWSVLGRPDVPCSGRVECPDRSWQT
jgi:hypothetical protein